MSEFDEALDQIENDLGVASEPDVIQEDQVVENEEKDEGKPPGYLSYEEWIEAGKDPDLYKGKKAYEREYERVQERKENQREIKELKETLNQTVESINEWKDQERNKIRSELESELKVATDGRDLERALEIKDQLHQMDQQPQEAPQENPLITNFRQRNPIVDPNSPMHDESFHQDMQSIQRTIIDDLTGRDPERMSQLTEAQITRSLDIAYKKAKDLHPHLFKSPRNGRQAPTDRDWETSS